MKILVIAACLASAFEKIATIGSTRTDDESFKKYIQELLQNFKEAMKTGIPELNIPVLEPYSVDNINIVKKDNHFDVTLSIKDLKISGLSGFEIPQIDASLQDMRLTFILNIPSLIVTSDQYNLNGKIFRIFPLTGNGKMRLEAHKLSIKMDTTLALNSDSSLRINTMETDLNFQSVDIKLDNFLGGGSFGNVINQILSSLAKILFDKFKPQVKNALQDSLRKAIDSRLSKIKITDLIKNEPGKSSTDVPDDVKFHNSFEDIFLEPSGIDKFTEILNRNKNNKTVNS